MENERLMCPHCLRWFSIEKLPEPLYRVMQQSVVCTRNRQTGTCAMPINRYVFMRSESVMTIPGLAQLANALDASLESTPGWKTERDPIVVQPDPAVRTTGFHKKLPPAPREWTKDDLDFLKGMNIGDVKI